MTFAAGPEGEVTVLDFSKGAFVRWGPDGDLLERRQVGARPLSSLIRPALRDPGPGVLLAVPEMLGEDGFRPLRLRWFRDTDTLTLASLPHPPIGEVRPRGCGIRILRPPLFTPELNWSAAGDWIAVSAGPAYDIRIFRSDSLVRRVRRALPLREATADLARTAVGEGFTLGTGSRACTFTDEDLVEGRGFAQWVPWITAVEVSPAGELWVLRNEVGERGAVDVFGPDGAYQGSLPPETPFPLIFVDEDRIAVKRTDAMDVERIVVMEVRR